MSTPSPQTPEALASRQTGYDLTRDYLIAAVFSDSPVDLDALRKGVGDTRAKYLATGDWEGVWQAAGALDAIREASQPLTVEAAS